MPWITPQTHEGVLGVLTVCHAFAPDKSQRQILENTLRAMWQWPNAQWKTPDDWIRAQVALAERHVARSMGRDGDPDTQQGA